VTSPFLETIMEFPQEEVRFPLPPNMYTLGPDGFDPQSLISYISTAKSNEFIAVYLPPKELSLT